MKRHVCFHSISVFTGKQWQWALSRASQPTTTRHQAMVVLFWSHQLESRGRRLSQGCAFRSDWAWLMKSCLHIFGYICCKDASNSNVLLNTQWLINPSWVGWKFWADTSLFSWPCWDQTLLVYVLMWTENNLFLYQVYDGASSSTSASFSLCFSSVPTQLLFPIERHLIWERDYLPSLHFAQRVAQWRRDLLLLFSILC